MSALTVRLMRGAPPDVSQHCSRPGDHRLARPPLRPTTTTTTTPTTATTTATTRIVGSTTTTTGITTTTTTTTITTVITTIMAITIMTTITTATPSSVRSEQERASHPPHAHAQAGPAHKLRVLPVITVGRGRAAPALFSLSGRFGPGATVSGQRSLPARALRLGDAQGRRVSR